MKQGMLFAEEIITGRWDNLKGVYSSKSLCVHFEKLEKSVDVKYEIPLFAKLVNMSLAGNAPYHRWIRYREGYSGQLVQEILRRYPLRRRKDLVLDPMCGSGSTLVAARESGYDGLGLDVNPYAVLCSNVKLAKLSKVDRMQIERIMPGIESQKVVTHDLTENEIFLAKYFEPRNYSALISIKRIIQALETEAVKAFLWLALLASIEDCSERMKDGNGLATRKSRVTDVAVRFREQVEMMLSDVVSYPLPEMIISRAIDASALELGTYVHNALQNTKLKIGMIMFSPPYANSFDYFESYKLELLFGDYFSYTGLLDARKRLIRNYRIGGVHSEIKSDLPTVEDLCSEIWTRIPIKEKKKGIRDGRTRLVPNMLRSYFSDMGKVIAEGFYSLRRSGTMHIVVDQSAYVGIPIPTDLVFCEIARKVGFIVDQVIVCRSSKTSGQQLQESPVLGKLLRESIVCLRKP